MRYRFIEAEKAQYPVQELCRVLGVARSGYYAWRRPPLQSPATAGSEAPGADSSQLPRGPGVLWKFRGSITTCGRGAFGWGDITFLQTRSG